MADVLARTDPVSSPAFVSEGVTVRLAGPMVRFSLRSLQPEALEMLLGLTLPRQIGATQDGVACLGPDEWLLRAPAGTTLATAEGARTPE